MDSSTESTISEKVVTESSSSSSSKVVKHKQPSRRFSDSQIATLNAYYREERGRTMHACHLLYAALLKVKSKYVMCTCIISRVYFAYFVSITVFS